MMKEVGETHQFPSLSLHLDELGRTKEPEPNLLCASDFSPAAGHSYLFFSTLSKFVRTSVMSNGTECMTAAPRYADELCQLTHNFLSDQYRPSHHIKSQI
jgi:hypothetical protein